MSFMSSGPSSVWDSKIFQLGSHKNFGNIEKVLALGTQLGFADLWSGILVCDVLREDVMVRFIPFPRLLDGNLAKDRTGSARLFRDVMCCNGVIRCVEIETILAEAPQKRTVVKEKDLSLTDVFYDHELMSHQDTREEGMPEYLGWKVILWRRTISSSLCWYKDEAFHMDDIHIDNCYMRLVADLGGFKSFFTLAPTLTLYWTNYLYLLAKTRSELCCVILVDMKERKLEDLRVLMQKPDLFNPTYIPCSLSKYLSIVSDGIPIGEQNGLNSSYTQPYEDGSDFDDLCNEAVKNNYPRAILYSGYQDISPGTPSGTFPCSYHHRQQLQQQPINESGSSYATSSSYLGISPHTPSSYTNYQQQQGVGHLPVSWSGSSCQQQEFACAWRQSASPSMSSPPNDQGSVVDNFGGYHQSPPILPSDAQCWQQAPLLSWSNPYLQKQRAHAGACPFQGTSRFAAREAS